jgi:hypothetical protein
MVTRMVTPARGHGVKATRGAAGPAGAYRGSAARPASPASRCSAPRPAATPSCGNPYD